MNGDHTARAILSQTPLGDVWEERDRQDRKWGEQNHDLTVWMTVLGEEFGETCHASLHYRAAAGRAENVEGDTDPDAWLAKVRKEAIQTAAVAVAIVEFIDRGMKPSTTAVAAFLDGVWPTPAARPSGQWLVDAIEDAAPFACPVCGQPVRDQFEHADGSDPSGHRAPAAPEPIDRDALGAREHIIVTLTPDAPVAASERCHEHVEGCDRDDAHAHAAGWVVTDGTGWEPAPAPVASRVQTIREQQAAGGGPVTEVMVSRSAEVPAAPVAASERCGDRSWDSRYVCRRPPHEDGVLPGAHDYIFEPVQPAPAPVAASVEPNDSCPFRCGHHGGACGRCLDWHTAPAAPAEDAG